MQISGEELEVITMNIYPGAGRFLYTSQYSTALFRTDVFQGNVSHIHRPVLGILQYISQFMVNTCSSLAVSLEGANARKKTRLRKTSGGAQTKALQ